MSLIIIEGDKPNGDNWLSNLDILLSEFYLLFSIGLSFSISLGEAFVEEY